MEDLLKLEYESLSQEIREHTRTQITFLTLSVTATGLFLGFAGKGQGGHSLGYTYLLPLMIVLPSWWVFFDRATTITRIVGYLRLLEKMILKKGTYPEWLGWQNTLGRIRKEPRESRDPKIEGSKLGLFLELFLLRKASRYWMLVHFIFLGLSGACWLIAFFQTSQVSAWVLFGSLILICGTALWGFAMILHLVYGRYSYDNNERISEHILTQQTGTRRESQPEQRDGM